MHPTNLVPRITLSVALVSAVLAAALIQAQTPDDEEAFMRTVKVTRWDDPNTRPDTYLEYLAARARSGHALDAPFSAELAYRSPPEVYASPNRLDVFLESSLHEGIKADLAGYHHDLEVEGWGVTLWVCAGGMPSDLRAFLVRRRQEAGILGCLMIGELPVAWYEMDDDFDNKHAEFPSDLYYMDLDGTFGDQDLDGKFDSHTASSTGDQRPDIFVGRLKAGPLAGTWGTEAELLSNYFRKLHAYRTGALSAPVRALAFQDDDWYTMATYQNRAYAQVVTVSDPYETTAANYRTRLGESYHSVIVCAHSSPSGHSFKVPGSSGGSLSNSALWALDPPCLFYNLFACSNARYTSTRYMGGVYIFVKSLGLIAVGTTKTGAMLQFSDYYTALGRPDTFGEAFRYWFARRHPYSLDDRRWFYGMTLLGDPTIRIHRASLTADYASSGPGKGFTVDYTLKGRPDHAGRYYMILAAQTGPAPGLTLPGTRVPLNLDLLTWLFVFAANGPGFPNGWGWLDAKAEARAKFVWAGAIPKPLIGTDLYFSALLIDPVKPRFLQATPAAKVTLTE